VRVSSTIFGLVVLGLVLAGVFWARQRPLPSKGAAAGPIASAEVLSGTGDEAVPDVSIDDAVVQAGDARIEVSIAPHPPVALANVRVRVRADVNGAPRDFQGGRVSFEMTMPMGEHRYGLRPGAEGWQEADVVLPACPSGRRRWFATIQGDVAGQPRTVRVRLDLAPPGR
jgi:hypothetical protein